MIARGKCERSEHVAPGGRQNKAPRPERPKYYALSGLGAFLILSIQGRRASRLPLATIFRAFGAMY